jgi:hypothetical protein
MLLISGFALVEGVRAQQVPGYPVSGQLHFYIHFPAVLVALIVLAWIVAAWYRPSKRPADIIIIITLLCAPIYVAISGGGV